MQQNEIRNNVEQILEQNQVGTMATVRNNEPFSRYMTFIHDDLKLYTATSKATDKTDELQQNPYTHILIGYDGDGMGDEYVEYKGKVSVNDSEELKSQMWNDYMKNWFDGHEDPDYVILEVDPMQIRLMNKNDFTPNELNM